MANGSVSLIDGHIDEEIDYSESIIEEENVQIIEIGTEGGTKCC